MKIALAHDYLTQRGGAERVALELTRAFPNAPLYTSVHSPGQTFEEFSDVDIRTTWLQHVPSARRDPRTVLPLLTHAWDSHDVTSADVMISSSTGFSHGIRVPEGCRKIVYCHNPPRWLYQREDYLRGRSQHLIMSILRRRLEQWDKRAAATADIYVANSTVVAGRIWSAYGIRAQVLHPPVLIDATGPQEAIKGLEPGFWLSIARGRGYKNVQAVADGIGQLPGEQLVVAGSASTAVMGDHVSALGIVSDAQLRWLYANARALVSVSFEDFGLTPLEANALGTPVAVLRAGGFLDSTHETVSGVFIEAPTAAAVAETLAHFPDFDSSAVKKHADLFSAASFAASLRRLAGLKGSAEVARQGPTAQQEKKVLDLRALDKPIPTSRDSDAI